MNRHSLTLAALLAAVALPASFALPAAAQEGWGIAADVGLGAEVAPGWLGAKDMKTTPWVLFRNFDVIAPGQSATADGSSDGLRVTPSFNLRGGRKADDGAALAGMDDIDGTVEFGLRARYTHGPVSGYLTARKGFGGHDGWAGAFGASYRIAPNDRLTLRPGLEARFGDKNFTRTFFGVSDAEAARTGYAQYQPDGGIYAVAAKLEARYALTDSLFVLAETEYAKLIGDAADAPFIEETAQPALRVGLVHRFNLRF